MVAKMQPPALETSDPNFWNLLYSAARHCGCQIQPVP